MKHLKYRQGTEPIFGNDCPSCGHTDELVLFCEGCQKHICDDCYREHNSVEDIECPPACGPDGRDHDINNHPEPGEPVVDCPKARGEGGHHSHEGGFEVCTPGIPDAAQ